MNQVIYIKGKFTANYTARAIRDLYVSPSQDYEFRNFSDFKIHDFEVIEPYDYKNLQVAPTYKIVGDVSNAILIKGDRTFKTDLQNVFIQDFQVYNVISRGAYDKLGKVDGIIYASIARQVEKEQITDTPIASELTNPVSQTSDHLTTPVDSTTTSLNRKKSFNNALNGCFQAFGCLFGLATLAAFLIPMLLAIKPLLFLLLGIFLMWLFGRLLKALSGVFAVLILLGALLLLLSSLLSKLNSENNQRQYRYTEDRDERSRLKVDTSQSTSDTAQLNNDSIYMEHFRNWDNYEFNRFSGWLSISQKQYFNTKRKRQDLEVYRNSVTSMFHEVYGALNSEDKEKMPRIFHLFDSIGHAQGLNKYQFAEMIVTCVQDIPYKLIVETDCDTYLNEHPDQIETAQRFGCMGHVKFGVQSPAEFMYNLAGDCDTRSLFLYTVLSHYGYDVTVLVSETYGHAILGINLPAQGYYKSYNGRTYYAWETTAKGMQLGQLSPEFSDMRNWSVCVVNN